MIAINRNQFFFIDLYYPIILWNQIKVAIADDHQIFRKGVILSMRPYTNIKFVMEAENGEDLLAKIPEAEPDVILM